MVPLFGNGADVIVQGAVGAVQVVGNVAMDIKNAAQQSEQLLSQGFNYVGNLAAQESETALQLFDSAVLQLTLRSGLSPAAGPPPPNLPPPPGGGPGTMARPKTLSLKAP